MRIRIKMYWLRIAFTALATCLFLSDRGSGTALAQDPGAQGPLAVTGRQYGSFTPAYQPPGFPRPVEQLAVIWHPTNMGNNVFPLVIFLHGRHATCYQGSAVFLEFPCRPGSQPIPNYRGYDYLAQRLASHGYIVVSISANGINALDDATADGGASARAWLIQRHLDIWRDFNNGRDPWGGIFRGRVNLNNVGTMGHSRGGEGVVRHVLLNASQGSPYRVRAVLPLAPVNFSRFVVNNVPLGVLLPYCDGDVSDLSGVHYYDDARYNVTSDAAPKHTFLVFGANHNFYNTVWTPGLFPAGAFDDWVVLGGGRGTTDPHCGSEGPGKRLTAAQQRSTGWAYVQGFFRVYVGNQAQFLAYLKNDAPPPPSAQTSQIHVSYHPAANQRLSVNRLLTSTNLTVNNLGGSVSQNGLTLYRLCGGSTPQPPRCLPTNQPFQREPHATAPRVDIRPGLSQLHLSWTSPVARYINQVPQASGDVSGFDRIQFRAGLDFTTGFNRFASQDLSVVLTDAAGRQAAVPVSAYSRALFFPPGLQLEVPKVTLNTVRIPLSAFQGIDLRNIRTVRFDFNRQSSGTLMISDLMFAR
ncbi:MAG: hypothetical protein AB1671_10660 [Thermodesulfobacteriota bacterium]